MVVGGCGFIGSVLVPELIRRRHDVHVVDLLWFGNHISDSIPLSLSRGDAKDLWESDLKGFDAIIFLAGLSNDPMADFSPMANYFYNAALPSYLAHIAKKAGVKVFVHGGSCSVYGLLEPDSRATEDIPPRAQTPYGVSKLMAEFGVMRQNGNGMRCVNFRMGTVCGWSPRMRFDLVINTMVKDALKGGIIKVNDPHAERPILDIRDAVSAYCQALTNEDLRGVYNLFSYNTRIGMLATKVQKRINEKLGDLRLSRQIAVEILGGHDNRSYTADSHKSAQAGIYCFGKVDSTIDGVLENVKGKIHDFEDPIYYNIRTFERTNLSSAGPASLAV
jgi:nucleoside-diphosphate-sugar epimerase